MNKTMQYMTALLISFVLLVCLSSCGMTSSPPSKVDIERRFESCKSDVELVAEFMISLPFEYVFIDNANGKYFADFEWHEITDRQILSSIEHLHDFGISDITKDINRNSIIVKMWSSYREIDCGVVYAITEYQKPSVQYLTKLEQLDTESWYYYIADYNEWRKYH